MKNIKKNIDNDAVKIICIHPPQYNSVDDRLDPPLGLMLISKVLKRLNCDVKICDLSGISEENWKIEYADIYALTVYTASYSTAKKISTKCKEINPSAKVIAGGAFPSYYPELFHSNNFFDACVVGDGMEAVISLIKDYPKLDRVYEKEIGNDLDKYFFPDWDGINIHSYSRKLNTLPCLPIISTLGCAYNCNFCALFKTHKNIKKRSIKNIIDEISFLRDRFGNISLNFIDDIFTLDESRMRALTDEVSKFNISYRCMDHPRLASFEKYSQLKKTGCEIICFGIESGAPQILKSMNKNSTVEQNAKAIEIAKNCGLTTRVFLIIGYPGETDETLLQTRKFIEAVKPHQVIASNFIPFPGTRIWQDYEKYGILYLSQDYDEYYQMDIYGQGGRPFIHRDLNLAQWKKMENKFRNWLKNYEQKGYLQDYTKRFKESTI